MSEQSSEQSSDSSLSQILTTDMMILLQDDILSKSYTVQNPILTDGPLHTFVSTLLVRFLLRWRDMCCLNMLLAARWNHSQRRQVAIDQGGID